MDFNKEQLLELTNVLLKSKAVSYEPNARLLLHNESAKEKYYVSDNDGHLTINYNQLAADVFAADFRKQVHGEWLPKETMIRTITAKNYTCSVCGYENGTTPFCPNCGAKMKGSED